jgi:hypothetical protein
MRIVNCFLIQPRAVGGAMPVMDGILGSFLPMREKADLSCTTSQRGSKGVSAEGVGVVVLGMWWCGSISGQFPALSTPGISVSLSV